MIAITRGLGYAVCIVSCFVTMITLSRVDRITVDTYSTGLRLTSNHTIATLKDAEQREMESGEQRGSLPYISRDRPVAIDLAHGVNVTPVLFFCVIITACFAFMTARMESESEPDAMAEQYSPLNPAVASSSSLVLWNSLFLALIASSHAFYILLACTPCSSTSLALVMILYVAPLAIMIQPRLPTRLYGSPAYMQPIDVETNGIPPQIPACGVSPAPASVVLLALGAWVASGFIQYDPNSYRGQLLLVVTISDMLIVGLGHLWDSPPSVDTVVNARLFFAATVSLGNLLLVWVYAAGGFPTRYA